MQTSNLFLLHSSGLSISSVLGWEEEEEKGRGDPFAHLALVWLSPFGAATSLLAFSASVGQHAKVDLLLCPTVQCSDVGIPCFPAPEYRK